MHLSYLGVVSAGLSAGFAAGITMGFICWGGRIKISGSSGKVTCGTNVVEQHPAIPTKRIVANRYLISWLLNLDVELDL